MNSIRLLKIIIGIFVFIGLPSISLAKSVNINSENEDINCVQTPFVEKDEILVVEIESVNVSTGWAKASNVTGFTGEGFYKWTSADKFNAPGSGLLQYKIYISNPGTYHFRWHNKILVGSSNTDSNDSWLRIPDADDFFAKNGSSIKYPKGGMFIQSNVTTEGSSSAGWMKVYCSGTTNWTWSCRTSDRDPHEIYATFNNPGIYTVQISGRSNGHGIDRFVMFKDSKYSVSQATNKALNETRCINTSIDKTSIEDSKIKIYPNPAQNYIVINNTSINKIVELKLYDLTGKYITIFSTLISSGNSYRLDLEELNLNGMYFLDMAMQSGERKVQKILFIK